MSQIFISYRRKDKLTLALSKSLKMVYGNENVFFDKDNIRTGENWPLALENGVKNCEAFVLVISSYWVSEESLKKLREDDGDQVRKEIERAIQLQKPIFPVLIDIQKMPDKDLLPESIQDISGSDMQYITINSNDFDVYVDKLLKDMSDRGVEQKVPPKEKILTSINKGKIRQALSTLQNRFDNNHADFNMIRDEYIYSQMTYLQERNYRNRLSIFVEQLTL